MAEEKKEKTPFDTLKKALPSEEDVKQLLPAPPPYPPLPSALLTKVFGVTVKEEKK